MCRQKKAFTLIELLIVVAIIAILAAIAVPNFLEAQVRAKVSRAKNDMRAQALALEAYRTDNNDYPWDVTPETDFWPAAWGKLPPGTLPRPTLRPLTTPIAYITSLPVDAFLRKAHAFWNPTGTNPLYTYEGPPWIRVADALGPFNGWQGPVVARWVMVTNGPDAKPSGGAWIIFGEKQMAEHFQSGASAQYDSNYTALYDATNGTISDGDIARCGP